MTPHKCNQTQLQAANVMATPEKQAMQELTQKISQMNETILDINKKVGKID